MEHNLRIVSPETAEALLELLDDAEALPLTVSGNSMTPFLVHERDIVYLSRVAGRLRRGDIALYRRSSGRFVLHRVVGVCDGEYVMLGDAQTKVERGIAESQICAKAVAVLRDGRMIREGDFTWRFFARVWTRVVPLRAVLVRAYSFVKRRCSGRGDI